MPSTTTTKREQHHLNLKVPKDWFLALEAEGAKKGLNVSSVVRMALAAHLEETGAVA